MQFYVIPPNKHVELSNLGQRLFCLAQNYIKDESYRNFFKSQVGKKWITLDNGAGDHDLVSSEQLIEVVKDLMPNEVIPPDYLYDKNKTLSSLFQFILIMKENNLLNKVEIMAVPQGKDKEDWLECYSEMLVNPYVNSIGMSKLAIPYAWLGVAKDDESIMNTRMDCVNLLIQQNLINKPLHFLGGSHLEEFKYYNTLCEPLIRSTDSCFSILSAIHNIDITSKDYVRPYTPKDYFQLEMTESQIHLAKINVNYLKETML